MTVVTVTTAGLSAATIGANEPFGAVIPATGVWVVATTLLTPGLLALWAKDTTKGEMISAAPSRAATRCLRRMLEGDMVVLSGRELIRRRCHFLLGNPPFSVSAAGTACLAVHGSRPDRQPASRAWIGPN
ncbi:hypothetical protein MesoLj131a_03710 [Mesorhizobium sp. 131-2-1]|nr:hypothetical protein MesoLj131a_03710 [Mesorhizobium sp. 131-2-1]